MLGLEDDAVGYVLRDPVRRAKVEVHVKGGEVRVIVDGDEPLDKLSVFEAIEMAKKWKERT